MRTTTFEPFGVRELDARTADGISVFLLWERVTNRIFVRIVDARAREEIRIPVDAEDALDAFHHPFAYAAHLGCAAYSGLSARDHASGEGVTT